MTFNFKDFASFTYIALFRSKGSYRLTPKRIGCLVAFYVIFPLIELATRVGFLLDDVFFRGYRREEVERPVFIVGNPRSGTTFLHRLMARDGQNFTTTHLWEVLLAPSITQRKMVQALAALDRRLGSRLRRRLAAWERRWQKDNVVRKIALRAPEEDQYLFLHIWSTLAVWTFSGILEEATPHLFFDTHVPPAEKERVMAFYRRCIQRHLHAHGGGRSRALHYLSKNPSNSSKIDTLYQFFPDARIIYLARNPLDLIPSNVSVLDHTWSFFGDPPEDHLGREYVLDMARHWYRYPLERLQRAPQDSYIVVKYDDLVGDPEPVIGAIYRRFGFEISPAFAQVLREEAEKARDYRSRHNYSLRQMGLTREQIIAEYRDVFDRFGFDTGEDVGEAGGQAGGPRDSTRRRVKRRGMRRARSRSRRRLVFV